MQIPARKGPNGGTAIHLVTFGIFGSFLARSMVFLCCKESKVAGCQCPCVKIAQCVCVVICFPKATRSFINWSPVVMLVLRFLIVVLVLGFQNSDCVCCVIFGVSSLAVCRFSEDYLFYFLDFKFGSSWT